MKIHAYFLCYNEEAILPHLLGHYSEFCDKITILNNMSTDKSVEIAKNWMFCDVEVVNWDSSGEIRDAGRRVERRLTGLLLEMLMNFCIILTFKSSYTKTVQLLSLSPKVTT